ncbi:hypothetical protein KIH75_09470 [Bifidobacterium sp. 64T4]|uniref:hypothetical protein n=1 Tax=Bifidobacterium pongonis TaxID=2834432 RepID=UPI001C57D008|nr:hypothetical protein [Bifidobacterium pongonis]MBW3095549.1 hypothetical protein [Bifidobacterium pongonis]
MRLYDSRSRSSRIASRLLVAFVMFALILGFAERHGIGQQFSADELTDIRSVISTAASIRSTAAASADFAQSTTHANDFANATQSTRNAIAAYDALASDDDITRFAAGSKSGFNLTDFNLSNVFNATPRSTVISKVDNLNNASTAMQTQTSALIDAMETAFANDFKADGGHWMVQVSDPATINDLVARYGKQRSYQTLQEHLDDLKTLYSLEQQVRQQVTDSIAALHTAETQAAAINVPANPLALDAAGWMSTTQTVASALGVQVKQTSVYGCGDQDNGSDSSQVIGFFCGAQATRNEVNLLVTHPDWPQVERSPLVVDDTKHELSHRSIMIVCGTTEPTIAANRMEAVTNSYAVLFYGADRERIANSQQGLYEYAMDAQSDAIAQAIHDGRCA